MSVKEVYTYPEDGIIDDPIEPLHVIDCEGPVLSKDEAGRVLCDWRVVIVCHHCLHKLEPDLWISDRCWAKLNPITPFHDLPYPVKDPNTRGTRWEVEVYAKDDKNA